MLQLLKVNVKQKVAKIKPILQRVTIDFNDFNEFNVFQCISMYLNVVRLHCSVST
jgi:hypothetical protein